MLSLRVFLAALCGGLACLLLASSPAQAAGAKGTFIETDTFGVGLLTHRFDTKETTTVANAAYMSDFFGFHYYVLEGLRVGLNFQFTSLMTKPPEGTSRFTTFSVLPTVAWDFWGPMYMEVMGAVSPRAYGKNQLELGLLGLLGAGMPLTDKLRGSIALEVPVSLRLQQSIGLTLLTGLAYRF